ncbi:MAG TPA: hypothetical protein VM165_09035 [Planctomycetaceae bacterium]|nr:hypothetical protein [Planctomycetaceae bacterium]
MVMVYLGIGVFLGALIMHLKELSICRGIVKATQDRENGLTWGDVSINIRRFAMCEKLQRIAENASDTTLRANAKLALRLDAIKLSFVGIAGLLMLLGAMAQ